VRGTPRVKRWVRACWRGNESGIAGDTRARPRRRSPFSGPRFPWRRSHLPLPIVDVPAVPERDDNDEEDVVGDGADDAVVADADAKPGPS
jgi:hypothetical protein